MKIIYFGSAGLLSELPLLALLAADHSIAALAVTEHTWQSLTNENQFAGYAIQQEQPPSILGIAAQNSIPVIQLADQLEQSESDIAAMQPDLILVSCFARRIPSQIFQIPRLGCFNLHPSLLPAYRGPAPIHWQLHNAETVSGVTVHQVVGELDAGDIAVQQELNVPAGVTAMELEYHLATLGGQALLLLLEQLQQGKLVLKPQDETAASYYGFPD